MAAPSKSTKSPAFQFYPSDFLGSSNVEMMSMAERGIYITLLSRCWLDNGLPTSLIELAKFAHMKRAQFERLWREGTISRCFIERSGRLHNKRLDIERRKQAEHKQRNSDAAHARWNKGRQSERNADALPVESQPASTPHDVGNALSLSTPFPSPSSERTHTRGGATLHQTHKAHAACGRVCVPADLHESFVRALNRADADSVLRDWYLVVDNEWSVGAKKDTPVGGNDYRFWRARFNEKWPSADEAHTPKSRKPFGTWRPSEAS